jgi:endonuclease YncB( thermonuclease family)
MFSFLKIIISTVLVICLVGILNAAPSAGVLYNYKIIRVIDGDTVVIATPFLPAPLKPELSLRIFGVDTPEKSFRAECDSEREAANKAAEFTKQQLASAKKIKILLMDWDKYGGRVLGDVIYDGKSLRTELIKNDLAREYFGDKKKSWCQ